MPSLQRFPDDIIITIDDDTVYDKNVIETLYNAYLEHGGRYVYCRRSRVIEQETQGDIHYTADKLNFCENRNNQALLALGVGGILYPPNTFSDEVFNEKTRAEMVPYEDDCWFNIMARLNGRQVFQVSAKEVTPLPSHRHNALAGITKKDGRTELNRQLSNLISHYEINLSG